MVTIPDDLQTLPTAPYDERPATIPLKYQEARTALWITEGNITRAAATLKVSPRTLRNFVKNHPGLQRELDEVKEQLVDLAVDNMRDLARGKVIPEHVPQVMGASKYILDKLGRKQGWGDPAGSGPVNVNIGGGIQWADGADISISPRKPDMKTIEHEATDV